jgi:hypothetical protein
MLLHSSTILKAYSFGCRVGNCSFYFHYIEFTLKLVKLFLSFPTLLQFDYVTNVGIIVASVEWLNSFCWFCNYWTLIGVCLYCVLSALRCG